MIAISVVLLLIVIHFIADFVMQSDYVAKNKSKSNSILLYHVSLYVLPFMLIISTLYGVINGAIHFCIDYVTSRLSGKLWAAGEVHWFFIIIGFDQLVHIATLVLTYY